MMLINYKLWLINRVYDFYVIEIENIVVVPGAAVVAEAEFSPDCTSAVGDLLIIVPESWSRKNDNCNDTNK